MEVSKEIIEKIKKTYKYSSHHEDKINAAIFGYNLLQQEIEQIKNAAIEQSNIATVRLYARDAEIENLRHIINGIISIVDNPNEDDKINLSYFVAWAIVAKKL